MTICTGLGQDGNWIVTPQMAAQRDGDKPLEESDCYPKGITAQQYFQEANDSLVHPVEFVELVPEPDNAVDPLAVKVLAQGKKIGFVPARNAALMHPFVALMRNEGIRCFVPVTEPGRIIDSFDDFDDGEDDDFSASWTKKKHAIGVMWLPTSRTVQRLCPVEKVFAMLDNVWGTLSEDALLEIRNKQWRFGEASFAEFRAHGLRLTTYPFTIDASQHEDFLLHQYLVNYRRLIHNDQESRYRAVRNLRMMERAEAGETYREVGETYGLKSGSVGQIVRDGRKGNDEKWRRTVEIIPADEDVLKEKILEKRWGLTGKSIIRRSRWIKHQQNLGRVELKEVNVMDDAASVAETNEREVNEASPGLRLLKSPTPDQRHSRPSDREEESQNGGFLRSAEKCPEQGSLVQTVTPGSLSMDGAGTPKKPRGFRHILTRLFG